MSKNRQSGVLMIVARVAVGKPAKQTETMGMLLALRISYWHANASTASESMQEVQPADLLPNNV